MQISVCIPTCNRPNFLREAILSAAQQSVRPFEILVGDDSSNNESEMLVASLHSKVSIKLRYLRNMPALGQARNVQTLFQLARGDVLALLHDDDRFRDGAFATLSKPLAENQNISATFGKQLIISESGEVNHSDSDALNKIFSRTPENAGIVSNTLEAGATGMFPNDGYFVRSEIAHQIDYFDSGKASKGCDYYFGLRLGLRERPFFFCDTFTCDYRLTKESSMRSGTNSGFFAMKLFFENVKESDFTQGMKKMIGSKIRVAISQGAKIDRKLCWKWYFSKWHFPFIFTPGGLNRLRRLLTP